MIKLKHTLVCLLMLLAGFMQAEENERFPKIEEMHNQKWQFLVAKAQLSAEDAKKVQPVFLSYEKSLWNLHQQNREFFRASKKGVKNVKPNYAELNDRFVDFEFKQALLLKNYHSQLCKILEPETLFNYYRAEREFKRKLLQDFHGHRVSERPKQQ